MVAEKVWSTLIIVFDCIGHKYHKLVSPDETVYKQQCSRTSTHCFSKDCGKRRIHAKKLHLQESIKMGWQHKQKITITNFPPRPRKIINK
jgi:hypothetical protein